MVTDNHYRWDFIQLSTDTKPTPATSPKVADGSTLYTSDDSKLYIWYKTQWYEKTSTGGGGGGEVVKTLSKEDYDFPTDNPVGIALWQLDEGIYKLSEDGTSIIYNAANPSVFKITRNAGESFLVLKKANGSVYMYDEVDDYQRPRLVWSAKNGATGGTIATIKDSEITTSLTQTIAGITVLDGTVGKNLKDLIDAIQTETFTFTLTDGTTVTKNICYKAS